jgi:hypothetical protein
VVSIRNEFCIGRYRHRLHDPHGCTRHSLDTAGSF